MSDILIEFLALVAGPGIVWAVFLAIVFRMIRKGEQAKRQQSQVGNNFYSRSETAMKRPVRKVPPLPIKLEPFTVTLSRFHWKRWDWYLNEKYKGCEIRVTVELLTHRERGGK